MMNYQEKEAQLDIYDVKKALLYRNRTTMCGVPTTI